MSQVPTSQPNGPPPGLRHPGRWLWLLLALPVALGLARLRFDVEIFDLLPTDLIAVKGLKLYQEYFANARELIVTVKGSDAEQAEGSALKLVEQLRADTNLVASVTWRPPWEEHPDQLAELLAYLWFNQPPAIFRELSNLLAPEKLPGMLQAAREELATSLSPDQIARLSYDPFGFTRLPESSAAAAPSFGPGQNTFSSTDGKFRLIFVEARDSLRTYKDCQQFLTAVRENAGKALSGAGQAGAITLGFTGRPAFVAEISAGMQHDITSSVGGTAAIIALLFWLAHHRVKPMLWLLTLLAIILGTDLALGGLIYGTINVVSMGFAAILLGLAVDYAVVHYQEALAEPQLSVPQIRRAIAPSIAWAAITTITAFLVLNFGGLPGLGQLGTLVAVGVALAATIMIFEFLPPLFPARNTEGRPPASPPLAAPLTPSAPAILPHSPVLPPRLSLAITGSVVVVTSAFLLSGLPPVDPTANALRPRHSSAYATADEIRTLLTHSRDPLWILVGEASVTNVAHQLEQVESALQAAVSNHQVVGFTLPMPLWPRTEYQAANRATAVGLLKERETLRTAALSAGFATNALGLTDGILNTWRVAVQTPGIYWPTNPMSQWIINKFAAHTSSNYLALGWVNADDTGGSASHEARLAALASSLPRNGVWLSGWELLGNSVFSRVRENMWKVLAPMVGLVLLSLCLAFRRPLEIALSLAVLLLSALCLMTVMRLAHWSWNLLNLMAIPLVLGTGVDYSIFMQLALRRHHGDLAMAYRAVGRALLLCGGTAIAGFGSLAWSTNAGMASLGQVCAVGIGCNMLIAIFLLPAWWKPPKRAGSESEGTQQPIASPASPISSKPPPSTSGPAGAQSPAAPTHPSRFYRSELWRCALWLVRVLPTRQCTQLSRMMAGVYWQLAPHRRQVVIENLLPAVKGDATVARRTARNLFKQFALKLTDLWRYEAGLSIDDLFGPTSGWEHFTQAQAAGRGILLVTPHLGNWEFGGPSLSQRGVALQVLTLAEPGEGFTELREASRARWKIETLVVRDDPFAFLEVIRRLEAGATVAMLIDRPAPETAVPVELFGHQFPASLAVAELARASGCVILPVYLPRLNGSYEAHILPPVPYERALLRDRQARQQLTQQIIRVFEPLILRHLDQWYHFVPIWPHQANGEESTCAAARLRNGSK